jgi:hypothetical protein
MSRNGELALKRVVVSYGINGGVPGVRQALAREIPAFKRKYPTVEIDLRPREWPERAITGFFRDGSEKTFTVDKMSAQGIWIRMNRLAGSCNDHNVRFSAQHMHFQRRSVQGNWNPWLWSAEKNVARTEEPRWDRQLTEDEWAFYVDKYSARMARDDAEIGEKASRLTDLPKQYTAEVAQRWAEHVTPALQTDVEHNLAHYKKQAAKGTFPKPVAMGEYRLFAVPDHTTMGHDLLSGLRKEESNRLEQWWTKRQEQLKPPK